MANNKKIQLTPEEKFLEAVFGKVKNPKISDPLTEEQQQRLKEKIDAVLKTLTYRERKIIKLRYGMGETTATHSLQEVGRIFKVTLGRVRQIETKAIRKLQHPVRKGMLEEE